jgi:hypothetical protein
MMPSLRRAQHSDADLFFLRLFNNPAISDVTIKQVYNEQVREYHAHKAILCMESEYFLNMFTGNFKVKIYNLKFPSEITADIK